MNRRRQSSSLFRSPQARQAFARTFVRISLGLSLLLTIAGALLVYRVSPLRDPAFQPNSGNAGSLVPWLQGMGDRTWSWAAAGLAGLLASNLVLLLSFSRSRIGSNDRVLMAIIYLAIWIVSFAGLWMLFLGYLLAQWLID